MQDYELLVWDDADGPAETIRFQAGGVPDALNLAYRHRSVHPAELWHHGRRICSLRYSELHGFWTVAAPMSTGDHDGS